MLCVSSAGGGPKPSYLFQGPFSMRSSSMSAPVSRRNFLGAGATAAALGFVFAGAGCLAPFVRPGNMATRNAATAFRTWCA